jgi:hypothetical protein
MAKTTAKTTSKPTPKPKKPAALPTTPVQLRVPDYIINRVDLVAQRSHSTRTAILLMMIESSLEVVEKIMNPSVWFSDPSVIRAMEDAVKGEIEGEEKSKQSPKTQG